MREYDLYYKIVENGYYIMDKNDPLFKIYQYDQYIPYRLADETKKNTAEEYEYSAKKQIEELIQMWEESKNKVDKENEIAEQVSQLKTKNEELTNALLELADIVYA